MPSIQELTDRLESENKLNRADWLAILGHSRDESSVAYLADRAGAARDRVFGRRVFLRGLIEYTSFCKNDCLYCGLRRSNSEAERYCLSRDQILDRCRAGRALGFRTFVLQGGEDPGAHDQELSGTISAIRNEFPDCAITLSVGEKSREVYQAFFQAGADRFLLRHETANESHYRRLHPPSMSLAGRKRCLYDLKEIGFQVGAGFMVGSPWQTEENLAEDLEFLSELSPQMVGIGPFIPHPKTPLGKFPPGSPKLTLFILGLVRLMLPKVLLPATTALGTLDFGAREEALAFGANVLMPNLSPLEVRKKYEIYTGKIHQDEEAAEGVRRLKDRLKELGYEVPDVRGDSPDYHRP